jgi:hypothetical protein
VNRSGLAGIAQMLSESGNRVKALPIATTVADSITIYR